MADAGGPPGSQLGCSFVPGVGGADAGRGSFLWPASKRAQRLGSRIAQLDAMLIGLVPAAPKLPFLRLDDSSLGLAVAPSLGLRVPSVRAAATSASGGVRASALAAIQKKLLVAGGLAQAGGASGPDRWRFLRFVKGSRASDPGRASLRAVLVAAVIPP